MAQQPGQVQRHFSTTDADSIANGRTMREAFIQDQADFVNNDPAFATPYEDNWEDSINAFEAVPTDEQVDDQLTQLTNLVKEKMTDCRDYYQDTKRFIQRAFPNNPLKWNEFGFDDYADASAGANSFIHFYFRLHGTASIAANKAALIAVNYLQPKIDMILTKHDELRDSNRNQDIFNESIPGITRERIVKGNAAYAFQQDVAEVGKRLYKDNFAKYVRYLLPPGDESAEAFSISGVAKDAVSGNPIEDLAALVVGTAFTTATNSTGAYGIAGVPDGTYSVRFTKPGYVDLQIDNVVIASGSPVTLDASMQPV